MNPTQARDLICQTFPEAFDKTRFRNFAINLLNHIDESKAQVWQHQYIKAAFKGHVQRYERLGTYTCPDNEKLDVLIVYLTTESTLERARTAIRNFVADHLKTRDEKEAALVAFVSPTEKQWRFSYVKMEYATVEKESGKAGPEQSRRVGVETRLTPARRFSYIVGEGESCHTAQTRFLELLQDTATDPTLAQIEDAFSVEAVTDEFFKKYRALFEDTHTALEKIVAKDKTIHDEFTNKGIKTVDFAKKLLGQIVFLYFLQKKGWLGVEKGEEWGTGPRDFLRKLAKGDYGKYGNFFNDILEPLFYDTLATDRGHVAWCEPFKCRIPFLNGGLFEPLGDYDWKKTHIEIAARLFSNSEETEQGDIGTGILDVFDRYNFTVNESEPLEKEVAIDPEMLGKVFERLLEVKERKAKGSFYTPREIVHYMCQESLVAYLDTAINYRQKALVSGKPKQAKLFDEPEPEQTTLQVLAYDVSIPRTDLESFIRMGDQAVHYESARVEGTGYKRNLPKSIEKNARLIDERLRDVTICDPAIGSGAFPVGMMTEVVHARSTLTPYFNDVSDRTPYHFKRHAIQNCLYGVDIDPGAVEIAKLRLWLSLVVDEEETKQIKPLPNLDYKIVAGNSLIGFPFKSQRLHEIEKLKARFFEETDHDCKAELKQDIECKLSECFAASKKSLGYEVNFDFEVFFSEVFHNRNGFDVMIANPPYVRVDEIPASQKELFKQTFRSTVGKYDLYYLFMEKGSQLLRPGGIMVFITPNKYCAASSARILRDIIFSAMGHCEIVSTSKLSVFEQAANYPVISVLQKSQHVTRVVVREALAVDRLRQSTNASYALRHDQFKQFPETLIPINADQKQIDFVLRLLENWPRLSSCFSISEGLRIPVKYEEETKSDFEIVKQYQFEKWTSVRRGSYISAHHLRSVASEDSARFRKIVDKKILIAEDALFITATLDEKNHVPQGGVYFGTVTSNKLDLKVVLGLLNSSLLSVIYKILFGGMHMGGGYLRYRTNFLEQLPVSDIPATESSIISDLVDRILAAKRRDSESETTVLEQEIDRLVYKLYDITLEEIKIVEDGT